MPISHYATMKLLIFFHYLWFLFFLIILHFVSVENHAFHWSILQSDLAFFGLWSCPKTVHVTCFKVCVSLGWKGAKAIQLARSFVQGPMIPQKLRSCEGRWKFVSVNRCSCASSGSSVNLTALHVVGLINWHLEKLGTKKSWRNTSSIYSHPSAHDAPAESESRATI